MSVQDRISDEELLLYHYREGLHSEERERIATALISRPEIAQRLQSLIAELDTAAAIPNEPVPEQTFERWHAALDREQTREVVRRPARSLMRWPILVAASAAVLAVAFLITVHLANDRIERESLTAMNPPARDLRWHLVSTQQQLAELPQTHGAERTALIDAVIAQNRMYALAAERQGDQRLAGALRSFAPILERLAREDAGSNESAAEVAQLTFELRVMQARLNWRTT
jgi:hypothetical protein